MLGNLEEEYLLRAWESALHIRTLKQFFLWASGEMQALLPHAILTCIHFDEQDVVRRIECLHNNSHTPATMSALNHPVEGHAVRLARHNRVNHNLPLILDQHATATRHVVADLYSELQRLKLDNALAIGTEALSGGASFFALFSLTEGPTERHVHCLNLLLPCLHLAFQRVLSLEGERSQTSISAGTSGPQESLTERESEILFWITKGKNKDEISMILKISPVTVKNHIHRIYKKLKVHNRVQAVLRCHSLRLLDTGKN